MDNAEFLADAGLKCEWTLPFGVGEFALYRDEFEWGVLVYFGEGREPRIYRPILPHGASVPEQVAEVARLKRQKDAHRAALAAAPLPKPFSPRKGSTP